ncbi:hypothetical protein BZA05DRAFT_449514 [Tricharina praecox]|uniref:uncharacterized protein n=1 Tax=Tricharina praecox TaxID=43433 RepID=UPI00221FD4AE|nr:uncharacterized protein BZA05DRAFT_449514 [Tricharina praecox]KAI5841631.1 hypothetical protein BZA05DRAFT_449514 [Tricharina praecox]
MKLPLLLVFFFFFAITVLSDPAPEPKGGKGFHAPKKPKSGVDSGGGGASSAAAVDARGVLPAAVLVAAVVLGYGLL